MPILQQSAFYLPFVIVSWLVYLLAACVCPNVCCHLFFLIHHLILAHLFVCWLWEKISYKRKQKAGLFVYFQYNYCAEGCCPEEYCAYKLICYPKIHCAFGCPDGKCYTDICMPDKPCTSNKECGMAHTCTINYNLGYKTCQYNLEIGRTVCEDRDGNSLIKPITW